MNNWIFGFYGGIGDSVCVLPAIKTVRETNPEVDIYVLADKQSAPIFRMAGIDKDKVIVFERFTPKTIYKTIKLWCLLKSFKFDRVFISPHARYGGWKISLFAFLIRTVKTHTIGSKLDKFGWLYTDSVSVNLNQHILEREFSFFLNAGILKSERIDLELPSFKIPEKSLCRIENILGEKLDRIKIGIHPGAGKRLRLWSNTSFAHLADRIIEEYSASIFLITRPQDTSIVIEILKNMEHFHQVKVIETNISDLMALIKVLDLFIGLDSGPVHIAAAFNIPTVVLFGPQNPELCRPYHKACEVVIKDGFACRPCDQIHCFKKNCTCMQAIEVEDVFRAIKKLLKK